MGSVGAPERRTNLYPDLSGGRREGWGRSANNEGRGDTAVGVKGRGSAQRSGRRPQQPVQDTQSDAPLLIPSSATHARSMISNAIREPSTTAGGAS